MYIFADNVNYFDSNKTLKSLLISFLLLISLHTWGQSPPSSFFTPADSLHANRLKTVVISESIAIPLGFMGLHQLWYKNYPTSDFHFINDNYQWMQMDKVGHVYSAYYLSKLGADLLHWSGVDEKKQLIYGAGLGFIVISTVEVFDGFSAQWGASKGDLLANATGSGLYVAQQLLWKEQKIIPKFSFHYTPYASARPNLLGDNFANQILKDYNGQTYWLSVNLNSVFSSKKIPNWLNIAVGYGAEGMVTAENKLVNSVFFPEKERTRQFYLSLDVDLRKIKTKSAFLKTVFETVNMIKIPAPTFEINHRGEIKGHLFYF